MRQLEHPVFIIGGSRTGSEMLKTMLSASDELDFVDELFLRCPKWLHIDLQENISRNIDDLQKTEALEELVDYLYSGQPFGWFWAEIDSELDRRMLHDELAHKELTLESIFRAIMLVHARMRNKKRGGAKFPLHYSYANLLREWFPECLIIHTTRNPKAVYASQANKYIQSDDGVIKRNWIRFKHFLHINIQITWTARIHRRFDGTKNYCLVRYEDIIANPKIELQRICDFLKVPFMEDMLNPQQYGSSYDNTSKDRGIDPRSLNRWKTAISPGTARLIEALHRSDARVFGYVK